jgi:hypothetical protein
MTSNSIKLTRAEATFRAMAFRIVYDGVFGGIADPTTRFAAAIAYSAREMNDRNLFSTWWAWTGGKSIKGLLKRGQEPPSELRPFVNAYLKATSERARQTGDDTVDLL